MSLNETYLNKILDATDIAGPIENGHLALKNVVSLLLSDGDIQTKREIEPVTNFQSTGKEVEVTYTSDYNDVDGLSAAYVTSEGQINGDALMADFTRTGFGRSVTSDASSPAGHCVCISDSQDAYIYNMLVSVVKALLYRSSKEEGKLGTEFGTLAGFRVARHQYSSNHVGIYGPDGPDTTFVSYCGPPTNTTSEYGLVMVGSTNYERISEFAHFPADTGAQMKFYADHLGGRDVTSSAFPATDKLNIEFDIPGVESDVGIMPYCGFNKRVEVEWALATVDYTNPYRMYDWVKAYVKANRLEKAFAAAHELITSLLLHPTWSSAEATTWDNTTLRVTLPKMKFGRAKFPQLLQGDPVKAVNYRTVVTCTTADDFQKDLIRGAIINYATWLGIYSLTIHTADAMGPNWRQAFNRGYYEPGTWGCYGMRTKMLSYLTGIDTISYEHAACGLYYDVSKMEHIKKEIKHKKHETPHPVIYDYIYAPVSGSLLLGAIRDVGPRISHLTSHYVVKCPESNNPRYEFSEALAFAQLQRFYGYDTTFFDACGKEVKPWANSSEWVLESASLYRDCHKMPYFTVSELIERPNSADQNLPRLQRIRRGMTFELLIKRPIIQQTKYGTRKKTAPTYTPLRSLVPITYKVRSAYTGQLISCPEVTVFPSLGDRDFRLAPDTSQPLRPVTTTSLGLEKEEPTSYMPSSSVLDVSTDSPSTSQVHSGTLPVRMAQEPAATSVGGLEPHGSADTKTGQQTYVPTPPDVWQGLEKPTDANRKTWGRAKFGPDGSELNLQSPLK